MKTLPIPCLDSDEEMDEFYNSGSIGFARTRNSYDVLERLDQQLKPYGLELILYDGTSDYIWKIQRTGEVPDFGMARQEGPGGMAFEAKAIVPGLTLYDLMVINQQGIDSAKPGDELAGNPARWPSIRGISAMIKAILHAIYDVPDKNYVVEV